MVIASAYFEGQETNPSPLEVQVLQRPGTPPYPGMRRQCSPCHMEQHGHKGKR